MSRPDWSEEVARLIRAAKGRLDMAVIANEQGDDAWVHDLRKAREFVEDAIREATKRSG